MIFEDCKAYWVVELSTERKEAVDSLLQKTQKISKPMGCFTPLFSLWFLLTICVPSHAGRIVYSIQVGAFKEFRYAMNEVNKLKGSGRYIFYRHERVKGRGELYRVYVEKYKGREEAASEAKRLKHLGLIKDYAIKTINEEEEIPLKEESKKSNPKVVIEKIILNQGKDGTETLSIHSNEFFWPSVLFSLGDRPPRMVISINRATAPEANPSTPPFHGELIKGIRNLSQLKGEKVMIILELAGDKKYGITQQYDEAENIFNLIVGPKPW